MRSCATQEHELEKHFDNQLIARAPRRSNTADTSRSRCPIRNTERAVGTMLGHEVTLRHGENGLPAGRST